MLAVFSFSCFMQTLIWNTWGPIAQSAKTVYGWSDGTIGLIPSLGNIACMCTVLLNCYFMDEKGKYSKPFVVCGIHISIYYFIILHLGPNKANLLLCYFACIDMM